MHGASMHHTQVAIIPNHEKAVNHPSEVEDFPFLMSSPMVDVFSIELMKAMIEEGHLCCVPVLPENELEKVIEALSESELYKVAWAIPIEGLEDYLDKMPRDGIFLLDARWGDTEEAIKAYSAIKNAPGRRSIISGPLGAGVVDDKVLEAVDILRVGVGTGSPSMLQEISGVGVPLFQLVAEYKARYSHTHQIIADGGIDSTGVGCKYLAAGADWLMIGKGFARCFESPNWEQKVNTNFSNGFNVWEDNTQWHKPYAGSHSDFNASRKDDLELYPYDGYLQIIDTEKTPMANVANLIRDYEEAAKLAAFHAGFKSVKDLISITARFTKISH